MKDNILVTVNTNPGARFTVRDWKINTDVPEDEKPEPQRVCVETDGICYDLVLGDNPAVEIFQLDERGEYVRMIERVSLTNYHIINDLIREVED